MYQFCSGQSISLSLNMSGYATIMVFMGGVAPISKVSVAGTIKIHYYDEGKSGDILSIYILSLNWEGQGVGMLQCNGYFKSSN